MNIFFFFGESLPILIFIFFFFFFFLFIFIYFFFTFILGESLNYQLSNIIFFFFSIIFGESVPVLNRKPDFGYPIKSRPSIYIAQSEFFFFFIARRIQVTLHCITVRKITYNHNSQYLTTSLTLHYLHKGVS